jgi:hypothetical protein
VKLTADNHPSLFGQEEMALKPDSEEDHLALSETTLKNFSLESSTLIIYLQLEMFIKLFIV